MTAFRIYILTVLTACMSWHCPIGLTTVASDSDVNVDELIRRLDSSRFEMRESATNELITLGADSLKPIAFHFLDATPEAAWRIKRVLENISVQSREEIASLKAIGILILLDHKVDEELEGLVQQWRENRSMRAINYLVSKGAQTAPSGVHRQLMIQPPMIQIQSTFQNPNSNPLRRTVRKKVPRKELRDEIEKVVNGDFDEVQKYVLNHLPALSGSDGRLVNDPFVVNGAMGGMGANRLSNTFLEFGDQWRGNIKDLQKLRDIHSLVAVRFKDQKLATDDLDFLSSLRALSHVGLANVQFNSGDLTDLVIPKSVTSLEFENCRIDEETVSWLSEHPVMSLVLNSCDLDATAMKSFEDFKVLQSLDIRRTKLDTHIFDQWMGMAELKRIYLSVCKFNPDDFRAFNKIRPRVIIFNPVSFLGVQAPRDSRGRFTCEIERVVAGSGAEKAGVMPGDIVTKVNDVEIEEFEELRMFISQFEVGGKLKLTVQRGEETLDLFAVLGTNTTIPLP